ncbi:MAG: YciI family protein [Candidatus Limnocylindria bacterium]
MPDPRTVGVAIFRAADQAAAEALAAADPAVREGVMQAEVYPFEVYLVASSWATV